MDEFWSRFLEYSNGITVRDEQAWRAGPFTSFTHYLETGIDISESTARRLIRISEPFSADVAATHDRTVITIPWPT